MSKRASEAEHPTKVDWKIPLRGKLGEWYPVVRVGRHVPFGYKQDENDEDLLIPIPEELELLEKAKISDELDNESRDKKIEKFKKSLKLQTKMPDDFVLKWFLESDIRDDERIEYWFYHQLDSLKDDEILKDTLILYSAEFLEQPDEKKVKEFYITRGIY